MSLPQDIANLAAQSAEKVTDEAIDHIGTDAPGIFERCLDVLTKFEFVIGFRRKV